MLLVGGLLTGRTHRIGVVSLGTAHFGPSSLLVALEREARGINYSLSIANSFEEDSSGLAEAPMPVPTGAPPSTT